ncbi:MAG: GNAT family N-acetyltransferase [Bacteroidales bacterium]
MKEIIPPVERSLIENELTESTMICKTFKANRQVHIIDCHNAPNTLREIGRLREVTFRDASGGTGKEIDLDEFDLSPKNPFKQLIVWDPTDREIIGGYRYIEGHKLEINEDGNVSTPTAHLFDFSKEFIANYLPYTIELGRSFVQPAYQPQNNPRKGLFSLDNIWDGLGALVFSKPETKYFFGKITMYLSYDKYARDLILFFLNKHFGDRDKLVVPHEPLTYFGDASEYEKLFNADNYEDDYKILNKEVRKRETHIPPLVNAYMNLSKTMLFFGTSLNKEFGDVEESGILLFIDDVKEEKKERYIDLVINKNKEE